MNLLSKHIEKKQFTLDAITLENYPFFKSSFGTLLQKSCNFKKEPIEKRINFSLHALKKISIVKRVAKPSLHSLQHRPVVYYSKKHSKVPLKTVKTCVLH